jgi:hypothetical protein
MRPIALVMAILASTPLAAFAQSTLTGTVSGPGASFGGELTFAATDDPNAFKVTGALQQGGANVPVDATATVSGNVITYTVDEKITSFIGALDHTGPEDVKLTYSFTLPGNATPAGTWQVSGTVASNPGGNGTVAAPTAPAAPSLDPIVQRALAVTPAQEAAAQAVDQKRFGVRPKHWLGFLVPPTGEPVATAVKAAVAATGNRLDPAWLYTVAIGEGLPLYLTEQKLGHKPELDGFEYLGTDTFSTRAADLKKKGFLPESFTKGKDYTPTTDTNELGQTVHSATYKTLAGGLTALGSLLLDSQANVEEDAKKIWGPNTKLTPDELRFWTYLDFNVGSGARRKFMENHPATWGDHRSGPERTDQREGKYNSIARVATARWLEDLGVFGGAPSPAPGRSPGVPGETPVAPHAPTAAQANEPLGD